jgi:sialic acid synthase SpsE
MHITRDTKQEGPDHSSSYDPKAFADAVSAAKTVRLMLGDGSIKTQDCALFLRRQFA